MSTTTPIDHDPLRAFAATKERVLDLARRTRELALSRDPQAVTTLEDLLRRFDESRFLVVAVGEFKRGKSTMVNALAARTICPMHVTPRTARLTRIFPTEGEREYVEVHFRTDRPAEQHELGAMPLDDLVARGGKHESEVSRADVYIRQAGQLLQAGVVLVDTPGLQSLFEQHDKITRDYLPRSDLILFALSATQPFSARERDFLMAHRDLLAKTVFVLNHMDLVPAEQVEETISFVTQSLREEVLGSAAADVPLFPISALRALEAHTLHDDEALAKSGLPPLARRIVDILARERGRPLLRAVAEGERDLARGIARQLEATRAARATAVTPDLRARSAQLLGTLRAGGASLERSVVSDIDAQVQTLVTVATERVESWRDQLKQEVRAAVAQYPTEAACRQALPRDLALRLQAWLDAYDAQLRAQFSRISRSTNQQCRAGFDAMEQEVSRVLAPGRARAGLAEIASGLEALAGLGAVAGCIGGPVGGYGLATAAIQPAFEVPPAVKALTFGAGVASLMAFVGGPIGWGGAVLGWLAVAVANLVRSSTWRERVAQQLERAVDDEVIPRARQAVMTEVWTFGRTLQEHAGAHVRAVRERLSQVVESLALQIEADAAAVTEELRALERDERLLLTISDEAGALAAELAPPVVAPGPPPAEEGTS